MLQVCDPSCWPSSQQTSESPARELRSWAWCKVCLLMPCMIYNAWVCVCVSVQIGSLRCTRLQLAATRKRSTFVWTSDRQTCGRGICKDEHLFILRLSLGSISYLNNSKVTTSAAATPHHTTPHQHLRFCLSQHDPFLNRVVTLVQGSWIVKVLRRLGRTRLWT
jgi:hypothetical protein